jgi:outer membrane protein assembly factor BamB
MPEHNLVFVGIKGAAIALDATTGRILWETHLEGSSFVHLVLDGENLYATTQGEVFCLDPVTGEPRWHNPLKGYGLGLASLVTSRGAVGLGAVLAAEELLRAEQQSSAAAAVAASAAPSS